MGLTQESTKIKSLEDIFHIEKKDNEFMIALAGNPNTGKSTVFNFLTGLSILATGLEKLSVLPVEIFLIKIIIMLL